MSDEIKSPPPSWYEPPDDDWGRCPSCGASQEDASRYGDVYICPCGAQYSDDDAHPDPRDDEPDLDREDRI